jgi:hypothetical protein
MRSTSCSLALGLTLTLASPRAPAEERAPTQERPLPDVERAFSFLVDPRGPAQGGVLVAHPLDEKNATSSALRTGARVLLSPPGARWRLVLDGGMVRELGGDMGIAAELTGSVDLGRVRLAATVHAEHLFGAGRDPIDLYAVAGVSLRVAGPLRLGVEYLLEDVEGAWEDDEAEGGLRHYLGPNLSLRFLRGRVLLSGGTAVQLAASTGVLGRVAFAYAY